MVLGGTCAGNLVWRNCGNVDLWSLLSLLECGCQSKCIHCSYDGCQLPCAYVNTCSCGDVSQASISDDLSSACVVGGFDHLPLSAMHVCGSSSVFPGGVSKLDRVCGCAVIGGHT